MSTAPSVKFEPLAYKTSIAYSQLPTNGDADFAFTRNTACDLIDVNGDSTEVAVNVPRYDYREDYIAPVDESYYRSNGNDVMASIGVVQNTFPFTVTGEFNLYDITGGQGIFGNVFSGNSGIYYSLHSLDGALRFFRRSGVNSTVLASFNIIPDFDYDYRLEFENNTSIRLLINNVQVFYSTTEVSVPLTNVNSFVIGTFKGSDPVSLFKGSHKNFRVWNKVLTTQEGTDIYNGLQIPDKYKGANNSTITSGAFNVGKQYRILVPGTTDFTLIGAVDSAIGTEFTATGIGAGTGTATSIGNVLNLSTGKIISTWYDLDHDVQGAVTGTTLNNSTDFGNNFNGVSTCPNLLLEPGFTNYFLNSRTPVTQIVTGLSTGTTYTVNCKGSGILTVSETGGLGNGGAATEVYSFTYTATQTSATITLEAGHSFDWVQMTNTSYPLNHVNTLGVSVAKAQDQVSGTGNVNNFNSREGVLYCGMSALVNDGTFRYVTISDGTINNRLSIRYFSSSNQIEGFVNVGGVSVFSFAYISEDITVLSKIALVYGDNNFALWVDGEKRQSLNVGNSYPENTLNVLNLSNYSLTEVLFARMKELQVYKTILTDTQLTELTTL